MESVKIEDEAPPQLTGRDEDIVDGRDDNAVRPPPRKRRRIVISCTECHRRKQKCDRKLPCTNCVSRGKQDACHYESGAPTMKDQRRRSANGGAASPDEDSGDSIPTKVADFGYSQTGASTLGFLKKIEGANPEEPLSRLNPNASHQADHFNVRERYKSLIRQLPARPYIDKLVDIYFVDFNWQYYGLDYDVFMRQLAEWNSLPFNVLSTGGPHALPPDLRAFPALLFQVLATALLVLPSGPDPTFDSLKYAGNMTFEDLALDYSESGVAINSLLGKRQMSVTTVLAGFLRAAFLKYVALVTEAWHAIGNAIRDAQEIGLHRESLDPKPKGDSAEAVLENQWEIQRRRRLWMTLVGWDTHTGVVLGRPLSIDINITPAIPPVDAPLPRDRSKTPVLPRDENDPPTPLTRALWAYDIMMPLRKILALEKDGPCPKDFSKVDAIHQEMLNLEEKTPPYFRLENPDTRYDSLPECYWVPFVRATLPQLMSFNFMALHRPYIFTRGKSRTEALKASLAMLYAQRMHFQSLNPQQYKTFSLFFGTFDAIVLMASIYILFPKEHPELVQKAMQHFRWSVERFEAMSTRNSLAKAALGVLQAIYIRLKKAVGTGCLEDAARSPFPLPSGQAMLGHGGGIAASSTADTSVSGTPGDVLSSPQLEHSVNGSVSGLSMSTPGTTTTNSALGDLYGATGVNGAGAGALDLQAQEQQHPHHQHQDHQQDQQQQQNFDWAVPADFDWSSIQPIFATGDLVYNDLVGTRDDTAVQQWVTAGAPGSSLLGELATQPWQFEGEFGNDSVWSLLNQYTPF